MTEVTTLGPAGAELLAAIHAEAFDPAVSGDAWEAKAFTELLSLPGTAALLAGRDGDPLGFVLLRTAADEAEILTLATRPAARRRGVARGLLSAAARTAQAAGAATLFLEVAATNAAALALYAGFGFSAVGRRRCYYRLSGGPVDAVVMARPLP
ncbi:GNAT family N-acetyltransferase [Aerophototrophica crusticola]|uniref:GNAT family N-acetyltransferase n=1 Tax=Aerophototrophica crusticola TaxID=1709002 RepID=A0A858R9P9_9PROT|nr:GNAT family N-acetyltransferase [Rhodospirillaceae bacterium B3]